MLMYNMPSPSFCVPQDFLSSNVLAWDMLADRYQSTFPVESLPLSRFVRAEHSVLDYGAGHGRVAEQLSALGVSQLLCCDASKRMCEEAARRLGSRAQVVQVAPRPTSLMAPQFDCVVLVGVLSSVIGPNERRIFLQSICSFVRPGGRLIFADFGVASSPMYVSRYARCNSFDEHTFQTQDGVWIHHFALAEMAELSLAGGFSSLEYSATVDAVTLHGNSISGHVVVATKGV